ncbi:MAG: 4Fe-4S binding protein [Syntrophobacteraceae bacterium]
MEQEMYQRLAKHLDNLPGGFPPTDSGVELRILKKLFTPEEAELASYLTLVPEESRVVARRAGMPREETAQRLDEMSKKGLIFKIRHETGPARYCAVQYAVGIWDLQVNKLDVELIQYMNEYRPILSKQYWKFPQMRTIPIGRSVALEHVALPYEIADELVKAQKKFSVGLCICCRERTMRGKSCGKPEERCLAFGELADYRIWNGMDRVIDLRETLEILKWADEAGLVLQPGNAKNSLSMCLCCGHCCKVLKVYKRSPRPATLVASPFHAAHNPETCQTCGTCVERCQMEALKLEDGAVRLDLDRCIGCGLCVSTCQTDSLHLVLKPESEQPQVPKDIIDTWIRLGKARGKITTLGLITMMVKSKVDRILA